MTFIVLFGMVSLFSDMTHESANSIRGAFLALTGASAAVIGFVSGLGELVGYGLRYVFGWLTDKTRRYWPMVLFGYTLDVVAVPALALVDRHGWVLACGLLIVQRLGKAIKKPAKDTVMSFAATQEGVGKSLCHSGIARPDRRCARPCAALSHHALPTARRCFQRLSYVLRLLSYPRCHYLIVIMGHV